MAMDKRPPEPLLQGRRAFEHIPFYEMLTDLEWFPTVNKWGLCCRIKVEPRGLVPESTTWYILVEECYPWGTIELYPAKDGGLQCTFPHQSYNGPGDQKLPWREGKICAQTSLRSFGRRMYDIEPLTASERLTWHITRARDWITAASHDQLIEPGDPFEFPDFPGASPSFEIAFREDETSFTFWEGNPCNSGFVDFAYPANNSAVFAVIAFKDAKGQPIRSIQYGDTLSLKASRIGLWLRVPRVPHIPPWQAPTTYGELIWVLSLMEIDLNHMLSGFARNIRDGTSHPLLIGFPIPSKVGSSNERYHWQGLLLPVLSHGKPKGFSSTEKGYVLRDKAQVLTQATRLLWVASRNWDPSEITARGRLSEGLAFKKILIIGVGALGSMISELLVREGCRRLVLVDYDRLQIGNVSRHILQLNDVRKMKASSVAARLRNVNPYVIITAIESRFPPTDSTDHASIADCDVIVDCTADDTVLNQLSVFDWQSEKLFFSISVGMQAKRLFLFSAHSPSFPHSTFIDLVRPLIKTEIQEYAGTTLPREGMGCWHPIFPARADDLWLFASIAVKIVEETVLAPIKSPSLRVYEQIYDKGMFQGVRRVS